LEVVNTLTVFLQECHPKEAQTFSRIVAATVADVLILRQAVSSAAKTPLGVGGRACYFDRSRVSVGRHKRVYSE